MRNWDLLFFRWFNECILSVAGTCTGKRKRKKSFLLCAAVIFASFWSDVIVGVPSPSKETKTIITSFTEKMSVVSRTAHLVHVCNALHGRVTINDTFSTAADDDVFFHFFSFVMFCSFYKKFLSEEKETVPTEKSETH